MAGIDKTYVNATQLREAIDWANKVGECTLPNGYTFHPINWIYGYNDIDDPNFWKEERDEYVLWNTPTWFDKWLWINCPLNFVRNRLKFQYGEDTLSSWKEFVYHNPKDNLNFGRQHYTFLKEPKFRDHKWWMMHGRRDNPWPDKKGMLTYFIEIIAPRNDKYSWMDDLKYDEQTDNWYSENDGYPAGNDFVWQLYHKNPPTKKAIIRQLRKWYIPKGYIVRVYQLKWKDFNFEILVK